MLLQALKLYLGCRHIMLFSYLTFSIRRAKDYDYQANMKLCVSTQVSKEKLYFIHPLFDESTGYAFIIDTKNWTAQMYDLKFQFIQTNYLSQSSTTVGSRCLYFHTLDAKKINWQTYQNMYLATELTLQPAKFIQSSVLYLANYSTAQNLGIQLLRTKVKIRKQEDFSIAVFYNPKRNFSELAIIVERPMKYHLWFSFMEQYKFHCDHYFCQCQNGKSRSMCQRTIFTENNYQFFSNITNSKILGFSAKQLQQRFMFRINDNLISKDCKQFNLQIGSCLLCSNYFNKATKLCVANCNWPDFNFTRKNISTGLKGKYCALCQLEQQRFCVTNCSSKFTLDKLQLTCDRLPSPQDDQSSPNRGGLIAGIVVAACLVTYLIVVGVYRWCKRAQANYMNSSVGTRAKQTIQKKEYIQRESGQNLEYECAICLQSQVQNLVALNCGHKFHQQCINLWMKKNDQCPICRAAL